MKKSQDQLIFEQEKPSIKFNLTSLYWLSTYYAIKYKVIIFQ